MSQYTDYTQASQDYDATRVPVGADRILTCLALNEIPVSDQAVLETGCGTGNYLRVLRPHVGRLVGVDFNESMLAQARAKLADDVELACGNILDLPYADHTFDGITCNQVIHHLEKGPGKGDDPASWEPSGFPNVTQFTQEAYRVLRPGGAFVINLTTHTQLFHGFWWAELIPLAVTRLRCRLPDLSQLEQILAAAGFEIESAVADLDSTLQGPSYLDPRGPLREAWRRGDSTWTLASDEELANAQQRVEQMNHAGTMLAYLQQREQKRKEFGQTTFVCARK